MTVVTLPGLVPRTFWFSKSLARALKRSLTSSTSFFLASRLAANKLAVACTIEGSSSALEFSSGEVEDGWWEEEAEEEALKKEEAWSASSRVSPHQSWDATLVESDSAERAGVVGRDMMAA